MVTVLLRGGLGNQMFQYALGLRLALKTASSIELDTLHLNARRPRKDSARRNYDLDIFTLNKHSRLTYLSRCADNRTRLPGLWIGAECLNIATRRLLRSQTIVTERTNRFMPEILLTTGNLLLVGYWQCEKYFADIEAEVRRAFTFRHPLEGEAKSIADSIRDSNSVSVHVRRGDYVASKHVEEVMGKTDLSYYERAANYMMDRVRDTGNTPPTFFVFSDDIEWCKRHLKLPAATYFVDGDSSGPKSSFHLELMSRCRNNIIANSSFSWWAAWLNANPDKIVVAPKRWRVTATDDDIVPESWHRA